MVNRKLTQPDNQSERIRILEDQLKQKELVIGTTFRSLARSPLIRPSKAKAKLIPRPKGQAGRGSDSGGYNLQVAMGLKDNDERYLRQNRIVKRYVHEKLLVSKSISKQDRGQVARVIANVQKDFPFFKKFEDGWPIHDMIRVYLSNEQTRARRDVEAELEYDDNSDSILLSDNNSHAVDSTTNPKNTTTKPPAKVTFAGSDGEDQAEDEEEPLPPSKKAISFPRKKQKNIVLSEPEDSDGDDLAQLIASSGKAKKELKKSKPTNEDDEDENKAKVDTTASKSVIPKTPKLRQKSTAAKSFPTPPPSKPKLETNTNSPLMWKDLPLHCPAAECSDKLPPKPIPSVLALFNKLQTLESSDGPNAKGSHLIQLQICLAITREKRREPLARLGDTRRWPTAFDYNDLSHRIFALKPEMESLITSSYKLDLSPFWDDFLLAINYQLADFCGSQTKIQFHEARILKKCGYFGPQGQFIIESCLRRMVEELKLEHDDLEEKLFITLHTVVTKGKNSEQLEYDNDSELAASNYLSLKDFSDYVLLPFVSSALILQDLPGLETLQDAIFEKRASGEFGECFAAEADNDEDAHTIHRQNVKAIRGLQSMKELPPSPPSMAPPRLRKLIKTEPSLMIRVPPMPPPPEEKEMTLADFPSPTKKKVVTRPKPKPKVKQQKRSQVSPQDMHNDKDYYRFVQLSQVSPQQRITTTLNMTVHAPSQFPEGRVASIMRSKLISKTVIILGATHNPPKPVIIIVKTPQAECKSTFLLRPLFPILNETLPQPTCTECHISKPWFPIIQALRLGKALLGIHSMLLEVI
ncbi:hypothetical protein C8F04DRAFT_1237718 [Mycena alexandri]|uniref:Uncharacterized protein n=1 Tax=Mycena alexandri TaxID=1745969 RepID=A0AAD6SIS9_9AGAR|nr:hypothetical protein C8F04DRAFT_1237718 [Mycena alexandri]